MKRTSILARNHLTVCVGLVCITATMISTATAAEGDTTKASLPPAKDIIAKFVQAIGGREAILKHTSLRSAGNLEMMAQGIKGSLEVFAARPNKFLVVSTIPGLGDIKQGFDGKVGWSTDPAQGPRILKGSELEQLRAQADFYSALHEATNYTTMETLEAVSFEGKDCYKVKLVTKAGTASEEIFDKDTGLLVGMITKQATLLGTIPVTSALSDYQEFEGVKMPTRISQKLMGIGQTMTFSQVEVNQVSDSVFELPEQIKALLK